MGATIEIFRQALKDWDCQPSLGFDCEDKNLMSFNSREAFEEWWCHDPGNEPYRDNKFYVRELTTASVIRRPNRIVEIGTGLGLGMIILRILNPWAEIFSIDNQTHVKAPDGHVYPTGYIAQHCGVKFTQIIGNSRNQRFSRADMVFIDGDHDRRAVRMDTECAVEWGASTIVWHDYSHCPDVIDQFCDYHNWDLRVYPDSDTVFATKP